MIGRGTRTLGWLGAAVVCFALAVPAVASAEGESATRKLPPAKERAKELTAKMKEKLALSDDQEPKVADINLRAAEGVDTAIALPGASRYDRFQSVKALQTQRDNELKGVLTQDQWKKYKKFKDEFKDAVSAKAELMKKEVY
jgi:hypothetical protein